MMASKMSVTHHPVAKVIHIVKLKMGKIAFHFLAWIHPKCTNGPGAARLRRIHVVVVITDHGEIFRRTTKVFGNAMKAFGIGLTLTDAGISDTNRKIRIETGSLKC